jgi:hypothetical protein
MVERPNSEIGIASTYILTNVPTSVEVVQTAFLFTPHKIPEKSHIYSRASKGEEEDLIAILASHPLPLKRFAEYDDVEVPRSNRG